MEYTLTHKYTILVRMHPILMDPKCDPNGHACDAGALSRLLHAHFDTIYD